jgi:hypothetical protein
MMRFDKRAPAYRLGRLPAGAAPVNRPGQQSAHSLGESVCRLRRDARAIAQKRAIRIRIFIVVFTRILLAIAGLLSVPRAAALSRLRNIEKIECNLRSNDEQKMT